jgi:hypothetical protein
VPEFIKNLIDDALGPVSFFTISIAGFAAMILFRRWWTRSWFIGPAALGFFVFYALSLTDHDFQLIVAKPDNVPITILFVTLGGLLWLAFRKMVINDELTAQGKPTFEARESNRRVLCWPDLVYSEFLCIIVSTIVLFVWAYYLKAPLEEPAHPTLTTNPSKAPWYFLGLQEMLVYFDPWLAGVVFPSLIIGGLMAIPFVDPNPKGNGYYTFNERAFSITFYLFGFIVLWVLLIILGTFLRGPNWNFFGPYAYWDPHLVESLNNISLSTYVWNYIFGQPLPSNILLRESVGFVIVIGYFVVMPPIFANFIFRKMYTQLGFIRFNTVVFFVLCMLALPLKMVLRWVFNLQYLVAIPEWFFNI